MSFLSGSGIVAGIICLCFAGIAPAGPCARDADAAGGAHVASAPDHPPSIPTDVSSVASGGYWEDAGRSGILRVIVVSRGCEQVSSQVSLEWLEERLGEPMRRVAVAPVAAINDAARWSVDTPALRASETGLIVELPAVELGSYAERRFVLTVPVKGVGRFKLQ